MSSERGPNYSEWSRADLKEGIAVVKAQIIALQKQVALKAKEKRKRQEAKTKLEQDIEDVKAKLWRYGVVADETGAGRRKRGTKDTSGRVGKKTKYAKRKSTIVKLPITVEYAD